MKNCQQPIKRKFGGCSVRLQMETALTWHGIYGPDSTTLRGEERLLTRGCCSGRGELVNHLSSKEREEKRRKLKYTMSRKLLKWQPT